MNSTSPNKSLHTNRRRQLPFQTVHFIRRWNRCQRPEPVAFGELGR